MKQLIVNADDLGLSEAVNRGIREAHERGTPVVVRAATPEAVKTALARPEVACVLVPTEELLALDLTELTYG